MEAQLADLKAQLAEAVASADYGKAAGLQAEIAPLEARIEAAASSRAAMEAEIEALKTQIGEAVAAADYARAAELQQKVVACTANMERGAAGQDADAVAEKESPVVVAEAAVVLAEPAAPMAQAAPEAAAPEPEMVQEPAVGTAPPQFCESSVSITCACFVVGDKQCSSDSLSLSRAAYFLRTSLNAKARLECMPFACDRRICLWPVTGSTVACVSKPFFILVRAAERCFMLRKGSGGGGYGMIISDDGSVTQVTEGGVAQASPSCCMR